MNKHSKPASFSAFARRVYEARKQAGLSQQALADLLHVSRNTVVNWESGRCSTDTKTAVALCNALGLSLDELMLPGKTDAPVSKLASPASPGAAADLEPGFALRHRHSEVQALTPAEQHVLSLYRSLSAGGQRKAQELLTLLQREKAGDSAPPSQPVTDKGFRLFAEYPGALPAGTRLEFVDTRPKPVILQINARNRQANAVVRVSGDSMEPMYRDGDLLYFRFANTARTGSDVVCSTIHGAIVKRMGEDGGLFSVNPQRPFEMKAASDNVRLLGIVTGIAEPGDWPSAEEAESLALRFHAEEADFRRKYRLENRD